MICEGIGIFNRSFVMGLDLITIVIPVYNAEPFLHENIESVINQTYRNLEIIYVCDGCTDRSVKILQEYAQTDSRMIVRVEDVNHGAAITRNIGMDMAKGDWLIFLDADDLCDCSMIKELYEIAVKEQADMVCCYYEYFDDVVNEDAHVYNVEKKIHCDTYPYINTQDELYHIMQIVDNSPVTKLVHKSIYSKREIFFPDMPNTEDVYYSMTAGINAEKIVFVDKPFYHYRSNKNRHTLSTDGDLAENYIFQVLDIVYSYIKERENSLFLMRSFYNKVFFELSNYRECPVYDILFDALRDIYFNKWEMYEPGIINELSYLNRIFYKSILDNRKDIDRQDWRMQARVDFVSDLSKKGCSIWGTGRMGKALLKEISKRGIKVEHVFDSDQDKWGKKIHGYIVEDFRKLQADHIIITVPQFYDEIVKSLGKRVTHVYNLEKQIWLVPCGNE